MDKVIWGRSNFKFNKTNDWIDNRPKWDMEIYFEGYSTVIKVVVPDAFVLDCLGNGAKWI